MFAISSCLYFEISVFVISGCLYFEISVFEILRVVCILARPDKYTAMCLSIGTPKIINFPFVPNGKFVIFRCPNN